MNIAAVGAGGDTPRILQASPLFFDVLVNVPAQRIVLFSDRGTKLFIASRFHFLPTVAVRTFEYPFSQTDVHGY